MKRSLCQPSAYLHSVTSIEQVVTRQSLNIIFHKNCYDIIFFVLSPASSLLLQYSLCFPLRSAARVSPSDLCTETVQSRLCTVDCSTTVSQLRQTRNYRDFYTHLGQCGGSFSEVTFFSLHAGEKKDF